MHVAGFDGPGDALSERHLRTGYAALPLPPRRAPRRTRTGGLWIFKPVLFHLS